MKTPLLLLLTNDPRLEQTVAEALVETCGLSHLTHCASDALETVCGVARGLGLAVIDFEHGSHGLNLVSAINMCRKDLPLIVITGDEEKHVAALAYACGASACLHKPLKTAEIVAAIKRFCHLEPELALVA